VTFLGMPAGSGNPHGDRPFADAARTALDDVQLHRNLGTI
jgi:hypothetical protein